MQTGTVRRFETLFHRYDFDFIILSCHQVDNQEFWTGEFQKGKSQEEYYHRYDEEILAVMKQYRDYSVLSHLDLIVRDDPAGVFPFEKTEDLAAETLKQAIRDGEGIELNTPSHRYGLKDLQPSRSILKLYRDLGGRIITIGSDSHKPEHLGADLDSDMEELKALGYREFCTIDHMKPIFHPL